MTRWAVDFSCTTCGNGRDGHFRRAHAVGMLTYLIRAARLGYPLRHRGCDGEMYDAHLVRAR